MKNGHNKKSSTKIPGLILPVLYIFCCLPIFLLEGCSPKVADVRLPYDTLESFSLAGEAELPDQWWLAFEDPELHFLIDSALQSNLPLESLWFQLQEARALVNIVSAARIPEVFLQLQSGISRPEPDFVGGGKYTAFSSGKL